MARVLLPINEPLVGPNGRMAGLQIRAYELGRALARAGHRAVIAAPGVQPTPDWPEKNLTCEALSEVRPEEFDACVVQPLVFHPLRSQLRKTRVLLDGYEFPYASFFSHATHMLPKAGAAAMHEYRRITDIYHRAMVAADCVIAANEPQRVGYLTILCSLGIVNPANPDPGKVIVVPSGAPPDPIPGRHELPAEWRLADRGPVVLWLAGSYPWFDERTFAEALPLIAEAIPDVQFLFVGLDGRDGGAKPFHLPGASDLYNSVQASDLLRPRTIFRPWTPYAERAFAYVASDVAVATQHPGVEAVYATRTRIYDFIWGRLPSVLTIGDTLTDQLVQSGAALPVPSHDAHALAAGVIRLLKEPALRAELRGRLDSLAKGDLGWDHQIRPLNEYLASLPERRTTRPTRYPLMQIHSSALLTVRRMGNAAAKLPRRVFRFARRAVGA